MSARIPFKVASLVRFVRCAVVVTTIALSGGISGGQAGAVPLSADFEYQVIANVGTTWQAVELDNAYDAAVPVCTYVTARLSDRSAVPRIRNIGESSFELRIQEFTGGANPTASTTPGTVFCTIADTGIHTLDDGRTVEARSIPAPTTAGQRVGWTTANRVDASGLFMAGFSSPVAMTGVISANDPQPSVVWTHDCEARGNPPFASGYGDGICVGKHIGQINGTRLAETIGIILVEAGTGVSQGIRYQFFNGARKIDGISSDSSTGYTTAFDFTAATVSQMGENGGQGGWATLVGSDPLPGSYIRVSIDEEVVAGDVSRTHIDEFVDVFGYRDDRSVSLQGDKTGSVWDPANEGLFAVPGEDIAYTLTVTNSGTGAVDASTLFLVDPLPDDVIFYNGDFDPSDGVSDSVRFTSNGSNLRFDFARDVGFSTGPAAPTSMAGCNATPASALDPSIRFVCLNPKGAMLSGDPDPTATFEFRVRIQ